MRYRYWFQRFKIWEQYDQGIWMTEDAWFGVTPEPIAKYHHRCTRISTTNLAQQNRGTHCRISTSREDSHCRCICWSRRQRHRPRQIWSVGACLRHRKRSQDPEVRKAQCRDIRRLEQNLLAARRLFRGHQQICWQQERRRIRKPAMGR
jgi:hypothetical protein